MNAKSYLSLDGVRILVNNIKTYVDSKIANLVGSAPDTLDTLEELATAFKENEEVVTVLNNAIVTKQDKITGTQGQFVVIGTDGNLTAITITQAEEMSF